MPTFVTPEPSMSPNAYYAQFLAETRALREILVDGELSAAVPGCPEWELADLGSHLGGVYRFATAALVEHRGVDAPDGPRTRNELLEWFDSGVAAVTAALTSADWHTDCWTMAAPRTHAFWARRMCHETMLHRFDAEASQRAATPIATPWAADGVAEIVTMFFPRQVRLRRIPPLVNTIELNLMDAGAAVLRLGGDGIKLPAPTASIAGSAADLLLLLWKRATADQLGVTIAGDTNAVREVLATALTP
jgi:uncharacterized protein (TIGR03083 family)